MALFNTSITVVTTTQLKSIETQISQLFTGCNLEKCTGLYEQYVDLVVLQNKVTWSHIKFVYLIHLLRIQHKTSMINVLSIFFFSVFAQFFSTEIPT